jgi:hypothetical protein
MSIKMNVTLIFVTLATWLTFNQFIIATLTSSVVK